MKNYNFKNSIINIYNENSNYIDNFKVEIFTKRLFIKSFSNSENDKQLYYKLFQDKESTVMYGTGSYDKEYVDERFKTWLTRLSNQEPFIGYMVFIKNNQNDEIIDEASISTNEFIGHCVFAPRKENQGECEFAILLDKKHWNKGYGYEVTDCFINEFSVALALENYKIDGIVFSTIFATARDDNQYSKRILEKVGMKRIDQKLLYGSIRNLYIKNIIID